MKHSDDITREDVEELIAGGAGVQTDWHDHDHPLVAIAETVGVFLNERPSDLPPLGRTIDGDALRRLLTESHDDAHTAVTFEYQGLEITITRTEILVVDPTAGS